MSLGRCPWSWRQLLDTLGTSIGSLTEITPFPLSVFTWVPSLKPTWGPPRPRVEPGLAWGEPEARGQASSRRYPGDKLQASGCAPAPGEAGQPALASLSRQLLLLLPRPGHLCAPGECGSQPQSTPERISPQMLVPSVPILSSGSRSSGTPEFTSGFGASP